MSDVPVKSTKRSLAILERLAGSEELGVSQLADSLDLAVSTTFDHLKTLERLDYVISDGDTYRMSTKSLSIGAKRRMKMPLFRAAKGEVQKLAYEIGEHCSLTIAEGGYSILLYMTKGSKAVKFDMNDGARTPLHTSASGKAILAHYPEEEVHELFDEVGLPAYTENTITGREELFEELRETRERGYAINAEEQVEGLYGFGVPILSNNADVLGALSIFGPAKRLRDKSVEEEATDMLLEAANIVEVDLRYEHL
ncbi:IclR family transcriptional regulator [Halobacteriales archaeon Cl-PHB]